MKTFLSIALIVSGFAALAYAGAYALPQPRWLGIYRCWSY